ncbi:TPA: helix-turn-helix transcriptional regulator [Pseudomonas aeruginosa]|nr:LuxR C-terminal-related transcriptional regulator [Pseudomonas aeruginosa]MBT1077943.1 helix-turn-helix transcriptional regulator [Pseudomonas aeruginosa]HBP5656351.1 helix-turn-helix transcriptional regulator [Pseudomonas aeruginosa]HCE7095832.1 helix-turn-helix transcriptional regulator [Pseudomonas aeruginosa]HCE7393229.1 helix-turn-helix transcriptional regulator [Pseudomonas aeruginosa]HCE7400409.1 helix-turn-helix transcriptional regulator [Pseudomonas aeruginosa]
MKIIINNDFPVAKVGADQITTLVSAKVHSCIYRPRLSIADGAAPRVCLYRAPPGYGKTVALAFEWLRHRTAGRPAVWLSLRASSYSEFDICAEIIEQLETFEMVKFSRVREGVSKPALLRDLASSLWQSTSNNEIETLVCLDNINHDLDLPLLHALMEFMLNTPKNIRFAVAGNTIKGFSQLKLAGAMREYTEKDLAFSAEEAVALAEAESVLGVPEEQIETLVQEVEGWPALVVFLLKRELPAKHISAVVEVDNYFRDEIFEAIPERYRVFLANSSLLDFVTPDQYNYVFKCVNGVSCIKYLSTNYMLLRHVSGEPAQFTLHPVLRNFLREITWTENPAKRSYLLKRAAFWNWRRGEYQYAIRISLRANDCRWAVSMSERIILDLSFRQGEIDALRQWLSELPKQAWHKKPIVLISYAWVLYFSQQGARAEKLIKDLSSQSDKKNKWQEKEWLQLVLAIGKATKDEMLSSEELCNKWISLFGDSNAVGKGAALTCLAFIFASEYRFAELEKVLAQAQAVNKFAKQNFAFGWLYVARFQQALASGKMGWARQIITQARTDSRAQMMESEFTSKMFDALELELHYELRCLDTSEEKLSKILEFISNHGVTDVFFSVCRAVSAWRLGRSDLNGSIEILEWAKAHAVEKNLPRLEVMSQIEIYQRLVCQGITGINNLKTLEDHKIFSGQHSAPLKARLLLVQSLVLSRDRNFHSAAHRALLAIQQARKINAGQLEVRGLLCLAGAQAGAGDLKKAQLNIVYAVEIAKQLQCFQTVLDEVCLIERIIPASCEAFTAVNLDQAIGAFSLPRIVEIGKSAENKADALLTRKQIAVLRLVKEGCSNKQIATNMHVTEDAIKWHMRKIFATLNVVNRTQATIEAERQGII